MIWKPVAKKSNRKWRAPGSPPNVAFLLQAAVYTTFAFQSKPDKLAYSASCLRLVSIKAK